MNRREMLKAALATLGVIVVGPPRLLERNSSSRRDPITRAVEAINAEPWPDGVEVRVFGVNAVRDPTRWPTSEGGPGFEWGPEHEALCVMVRGPGGRTSMVLIDVAGLRLSRDPGESAVAEVWMHVEAVQQELLPDVGRPTP